MYVTNIHRDVWMIHNNKSVYYTPISLPNFTPVKQLKKKISTRTRIPMHCQRLIAAGREMKDDTSLSTYYTT